MNKIIVVPETFNFYLSLLFLKLLGLILTLLNLVCPLFSQSNFCPAGDSRIEDIAL